MYMNFILVKQKKYLCGAFLVFIITIVILFLFPMTEYGYTDNIGLQVGKFDIRNDLLSSLNGSKLFYINKYNYLTGSDYLYFCGILEHEKIKKILESNLYDITLINDLSFPIKENIPSELLARMNLIKTSPYSATIAKNKHNSFAFGIYSNKTHVIRLNMSLDTNIIVGEISRLR